MAAKAECRARFGSVSITARSCKHPYSHARRRQGIFEHGLGKLRPKPTEMASQISPALGGSAGHFEALRHFAFEGEAEQGSDVVLYQVKGSIFGSAWRT